MPEWIVDLTANDSAAILRKALEDVDERDARILRGGAPVQEYAVARFNGFKIEVFADEHPPPHFRVKHGGDYANYTIRDCTQLNGGLQRYQGTIRKWHRLHKTTLIHEWNRRRPSACPVGEYENDA